MGRDGMRGAKRSDSSSYREHLQRSRPPESADACGAVTCSALPRFKPEFFQAEALEVQHDVYGLAQKGLDGR